MSETEYQMPPRLAGRVALVTGAGRAIGQAIARRLSAEGAAVAVAVGRDRASAEALAAELAAAGRRAVALVADLTTPEGAADAVAGTVAAFGRLDILVNNAGAYVRGALLDLDVAGWDQVFAVNARSVFLTSAAAARVMKDQPGGGTILSIAGASAHRSYPGAGAFGPSKAAVISLTRQMALEWADLGIRVNGVSPGPIRPTDEDWRTTDPVLAAQVPRIPLKTVGTPEDVASAVAFLVSPEAGYITGQMLIVDGGGVETWYIRP